jgi:hypothetical protein
MQNDPQFPPQPKDEEILIETSERTALIGATGFILGFAFSFFSAWGLGEGNGWDIFDYIALSGLILGVIILIIAIYRALLPHKQYHAYYAKTVRVFLIGVVVVFGAAIAGVFV